MAAFERAGHLRIIAQRRAVALRRHLLRKLVVAAVCMESDGFERIHMAWPHGHV